MKPNESPRHKALTSLKRVHRSLSDLHAYDPPGELDDFLREGELNRVVAFELDDTLELGLELREDFLNRFQSMHLPQHLDFNHLPDIAIAIEELSHLHTLMWKAQHNQEVSRLELEMQGELDKLLLILEWLNQRNEEAFAETVFERLLGRCELAPHVEKEEQKLYHDAHQLARHLGRGLMDKTPESRRKMAQDFFRLSGHQKMNFRF